MRLRDRALHPSVAAIATIGGLLGKFAIQNLTIGEEYEDEDEDEEEEEKEDEEEGEEDGEHERNGEGEDHVDLA